MDASNGPDLRAGLAADTVLMVVSDPFVVGCCIVMSFRRQRIVAGSEVRELPTYDTGQPSFWTPDP